MKTCDGKAGHCERGCAVDLGRFHGELFDMHHAGASSPWRHFWANAWTAYGQGSGDSRAVGCCLRVIMSQGHALIPHEVEGGVPLAITREALHKLVESLREEQLEEAYALLEALAK